MIITPRFDTLDYGNAALKGQEIKHARQRNEASARSAQDEEDRRAKAAEAQQIRQQLETMPAAIEEMDRRGFYEEADKLRTNYVNQMVSGAGIAQSLGTSLNENNYKQVRADMIQSGAITGDMWPTEYSAKFWEDQVKKVRGDIETHTRRWAKDGVIFNQDFLTQDGSIIWEGSAFENSSDRESRTDANNAANGGQANFKYSASDDNAMGNQATRLFGGTFDPQSGQFSGLDPEKSRRVQAVHTHATELYQAARGRLTHAQAVRQSAIALGISIEDPVETNAANPDGLNIPGLPGSIPLN